MATKKPAKKAAKPAKKAGAGKAAKKTSKPAGKAAPKKVAKKPAPAKQAVKKPAASKKPAPKPAPKPVKAAPPAKAIATKKEAPKAAVKPTPAPKPVVSAKPAPAPKAPKADKKKEKEAAAPAVPLVRIGTPVMPKAQPIVKKRVSTLEGGNKDRYSDDELEEFKGIINKKLDEARRDYDLLKQTLANTDNNGTEDTSPSFKMIEDGSETLSREETAQLASRQEKFIKHLEDALLRIRNKTYGICRVTGKLISKERLRLVPHATLSIEAKQQMNS